VGKRLAIGTIVTVLASVFFGMLSPASTLAAPAEKKLSQSELQRVTDTYLFVRTLDHFGQIRQERRHNAQLDWSTDDCTIPGVDKATASKPEGFNFTNPCRRHDFGYRNYRKQGRFTEENRAKLDYEFALDMRSICDAETDKVRKDRCVLIGIIYYKAVRKYGAAI